MLWVSLCLFRNGQKCLPFQQQQQQAKPIMIFPKHSYYHNHWQAFGIAIASSTDNFLVGMSLGLGDNTDTSRSSKIRLVIGIALCNAAGGWIATTAGEGFTNSHRYYVGSSSWIHPNLLAGLAFLVLAAMEVGGDQADSPTTPNEVNSTPRSRKHPNPAPNPPQTRRSKEPQFLQLAIPMTLNNLAGGVATGVAGVPPSMAALYVFWVSVALMGGGWELGKRTRATAAGATVRQTNSLKWWSAGIYLLVAAQCLWEG